MRCKEYILVIIQTVREYGNYKIFLLLVIGMIQTVREYGNYRIFFEKLC